MARVFPELAVHVKDLSAGYVLELLDKYPTPEKLARAKLQTLVKIPHLDQEKARTCWLPRPCRSVPAKQASPNKWCVRQSVRFAVSKPTRPSWRN